jgi:hypothetical protein
MQKSRNQKIFEQGLAVLLLWPVISVCDGSSPSAPATTGTGTGTGTIIFEQPQVSGIAGNFVVDHASPQGSFAMVLWQPNHFQANGQLVPTTWDAGVETGFTPSLVSGAQLGFQNRAGTSTAQMEGDTVGAYINSADLPQSSGDQKMMITPQFIFPAGSQPMPFAHALGSLSGSMDLQIPVAVGSDAYVVADLLFEDARGLRVSYGIEIFRNHEGRAVSGSGYDAPSGSYMLNVPLIGNQQFVTPAATSTATTGTPWSGWRTFEWSISEAQFVGALEHLEAQFPGKAISTDPAQYVLAEVHLNAEFHTKGQPAQLGWSMRGLTLWTTP